MIQNRPFLLLFPYFICEMRITPVVIIFWLCPCMRQNLKESHKSRRLSRRITLKKSYIALRFYIILWYSLQNNISSGFTSALPRYCFSFTFPSLFVYCFCSTVYIRCLITLCSNLLNNFIIGLQCIYWLSKLSS